MQYRETSAVHLCPLQEASRFSHLSCCLFCVYTEWVEGGGGISNLYEKEKPLCVFVSESQGITKASRIHPLETMNVWTKCHCNLFNSNRHRHSHIQKKQFPKKLNVTPLSI